MSISALNWAFEQDVTPAGRKFVLVALANYASEDGYCYPSQATLCAMTGQGERAVRDHLAWLEEAAFIRRERRTSEYRGRVSDGYVLLAPAARLTSRVQPAKSAGRSKAGAAGLPAISAGKSERGLPADNAGKSGGIYRQISPDLPAEFAGTYKDEPKEEPKDITPLPPFGGSDGGADGDPDAVTFEQVWDALPHAEGDPRRRAAVAFRAFEGAGADRRALLDAARRYAAVLAGQRDWKQRPMYAARFIRSGWQDWARVGHAHALLRQAREAAAVAREAPSPAGLRWQAGWAALRQGMGSAEFASWIADLVALDLDGDVLVLAAASAFRRDWIDTRFGDALRAACGPVRLVVAAGEGACS